jgi:hypothetical protein
MHRRVHKRKGTLQLTTAHLKPTIGNGALGIHARRLDSERLQEEHALQRRSSQ